MKMLNHKQVGERILESVWLDEYDLHGQHKTKPCNCLNDCGDDYERLNSGQVAPCLFRKENQECKKVEMKNYLKIIDDLNELKRKQKLKLNRDIIDKALNIIIGGKPC